MVPGWPRSPHEGPRRDQSLRTVSLLAFSLLALALIPVASAHGATAMGGLSSGHGIFLTLTGIVLLVGAVAAKRSGNLSPTRALYVALAGIFFTALGAVLFDGLSVDPTYTASSMPFPRSWYPLISLGGGLLVAIVSFVVGWLRWPDRPRYAFLGILMGLWISYPSLIPGTASDSHPIGYAIVLATPLLVGYIVWKDVGDTLSVVLRDPVARRFGFGVAVILGLFFLAITGYLSVFPEEGIPHSDKVIVLPVLYQLVTWPTLEIVLPHIPFFLAISPAQTLVVGTLSALIGLNAALIARHWRAQEEAGKIQGTAGSAAIVGTCTCGCCGPLVAKIAILVAGPAIAAPIYWLFVDPASPLSVIFIVGSLVLFTASLVYSVASARQPSQSPSAVAAD